MNGPHAKPDALKILQGTDRLDRMNTRQPEFEPLSVDAAPPALLPKTARTVWRDLVPKMAAAGLVTEVDVGAICMLCSEIAAYWQYTRRADRLPIDSKERYKLEQLKQMKFKSAEKLMVQFAMTPIARQKVILGGSFPGYDMGDALPPKPELK